MSETWGDAEIATLRAHVQHIADENGALRARAERAEAALTKINEIRNSIVGSQTINFSEHLYPLVAALNEAGFAGLPYPEARANVGTLLARAERAEAEVHRLKGLLLSETLCTMHYCERHGMAYQRPRRAQSGCPHCEAERAEAEVARLREALAGHACALECCVCGKTTEEPFLKARCECGESYNGPSLAAVLAALADSEKKEET